MTSNHKSLRQSRRRFLKTGLQVAAGGAVMGAGALGWRAADEDVFSPFDGPAYAPWHAWRTAPRAGSLALVQMAVLAASPHNTQPWLFDLHNGAIDVLADRKRHLGAFDPYRREMQIGLGCAVENIVQAAPAHGFSATVHASRRRLQVEETSTPERVATIELEEAARRQTELFETIAHRHTDRAGYDRSKSVPQTLTRAFTDFAADLDIRLDLFEKGARRDAFDALVVDATRAIVTDVQMVNASQRWFRNSPAAISRHRDGLTLDTMGLPPLMLVAAKILPAVDSATSHEYWLRQTREVHLPSARLTGLISVRDRYSARQNLTAGRVWQHMQLLATAAGISTQPLNQPVEMADREKQLSRGGKFDGRLAGLVGAGWQPTFAFRLGHPQRQAPPSPRRSAENRLA